jgi:mannosyltransferase
LKLLVGTIGEIKKQKGHEEFLRAAASVASIFPDAEFIIAGVDTSQQGEHLAALHKLVQQLNLGTRVHFTGWLNDVFPLLCALDLFVSASHTESFGLSIAEAMASGVAVVSTETEGAREIIKDRTGLLVPVGDAEAISRAVVSLLENPRERNLLAARAQESARLRFSLERMVNATEQIYLEAIAKR